MKTCCCAQASCRLVLSHLLQEGLSPRQAEATASYRGRTSGLELLFTDLVVLSACLGNAQMIGIETNRQLGEFALRYGRTLFEKALRRAAIHARRDPGGNREKIPLRRFAMPTPNEIAYCTNGRETVYGGGINPIGLKPNFRRAHRFQPVHRVDRGIRCVCAACAGGRSRRHAVQFHF